MLLARRFAVFVVVTWLGALMMALPASASAARPVTQTLNPPPPAFETCTATGSGAFCFGQRTVSQLEDTGIVCGDGSSAFGIVVSDTLDQMASRTYDRAGDLTRRWIQDVYSDGLLINSVTGASVPFTLHDTITDVLAVPADFNTATETVTGEGIITLPNGEPPYVSSGTTVSSVSDGAIEFEAGPNSVIDWFVNGAPPELPAEFQQVCAALGSS
jgi:hypothetical protein